MPKMKTHSASKKRFKKKKNNEFKRSKAFKRHLLTKKTTKAKRNLRQGVEVASCDRERLSRLLPN